MNQENQNLVPPTLSRENYSRFRDIIQIAIGRLPESTDLIPPEGLSLVTAVARCRDALKSLRVYGWDTYDPELLNRLSVYQVGRTAYLGQEKRRVALPKLDTSTEQQLPQRVATLKDAEQLRMLAYLFHTEVLITAIVFRPEFANVDLEIEATLKLYANTMIAEHTTKGQYVIL